MAKKTGKKARSSAKAKVTARTTIGSVLELHPKAAAVLEKFGMACVNCGGAQAEPIQKAAEQFGVDPRKVVREINKLVSE